MAHRERPAAHPPRPQLAHRRSHRATGVPQPHSETEPHHPDAAHPHRPHRRHHALRSHAHRPATDPEPATTRHPTPVSGPAAVKHRPIRYPDASTPKASAPGRLRPVRSIDAGQPDPAGVALGAPPGAVAGSSAFNAWMVADQNRIFGQRMPRGTTAGHRLRQLLATDPVVPIGQAKVVWAETTIGFTRPNASGPVHRFAPGRWPPAATSRGSPRHGCTGMGVRVIPIPVGQRPLDRGS
jgi:hypothetical protein